MTTQTEERVGEPSFTPAEVGVGTNSTPPPSTGLIWLFFHPRNRVSSVYAMPIPDHSLDTYVRDLDWAAALKRWFRFKVDESTLVFWKAGHQPRHFPLRYLILFSSRPLPCS